MTQKSEVGHSHNPEELFSELNVILKGFSTFEEFTHSSSTPLAAVATATSALTITSVLLILNSSDHLVQGFAALTLFITLLTSQISLFLLVMVFRASFKISRFRFNSENAHLLELSSIGPREMSLLVDLTHLARSGFRTLKLVEWLYKHVLWRFPYLFVPTTVILLTTALGLELWSRVG